MDGFVDRLHALRFLRACDPSYRALTFTLVGLFPPNTSAFFWTYDWVPCSPKGEFEVVIVIEVIDRRDVWVGPIPFPRRLHLRAYGWVRGQDFHESEMALFPERTD
jgi:hypothetical protein